MSFYHILVHLHSALRWILLFFILIAIVSAIINKAAAGDKKTAALGWGLWSMATAHIQLLVGPYPTPGRIGALLYQPEGDLCSFIHVKCGLPVFPCRAYTGDDHCHRTDHYWLHPREESR